MIFFSYALPLRMKYGRFFSHVVLFLIYPVRMCSIWVLIVLNSVYLLKLSAERFLVPNLIINSKQDKTEQKFTTSFSMVIILFPLLTPVELLVFSKLTSPLENTSVWYWYSIYNFKKVSLSFFSFSFSLAGKAQGSTNQMGLHEGKKK